VKRGGSGALVWGAAPLALGVLCCATRAHAAPPGQPFRLEYWARGLCPDAVEFARQIQTRAPLLRPAEGDEPALGFYAELDARGGSATGRLTARSPDGREVKREVRGATCDDVVTALALIAALAADPDQPVEAPRTQAAARPVHRGAARESDGPWDDAAADPLLEPIVPDPSERWTFGVGGGVEFDSSIAPSPGYGLGVAFEAEGPGGSAVRPFYSLSANRAAAASTQTGGGNAAFTWLAFRVTGCPFRWPEQTPLFIRPCGFLDAGELEGNVSLDAQSHEATHAWFALGAFARIEALVGEVVSFQLDGGVIAPLEHDEFRAGAGAPTAFQVPSAGALGRIGLSYRFQ
jgi:hypothetical protein